MSNTFDERLSKLPEERRRIVFTFHTFKSKYPQVKDIAIMKNTAKILKYKLAPTTKNSSFVVKVIREWREQS